MALVIALLKKKKPNIDGQQHNNKRIISFLIRSISLRSVDKMKLKYVQTRHTKLDDLNVIALASIVQQTNQHRLALQSISRINNRTNYDITTSFCSN